MLIVVEVLKPQTAVSADSAALSASESQADLAEIETETEIETEALLESTVVDKTAPSIYGVIPIKVYANHSVSYKTGIYVEDDIDENPVLTVDNDDVNLSVPGEYQLKYIATDASGNESIKYTTVTVLEGDYIVDDDEIWALADAVLDEIITDDMDDKNKCLAVYKYLHSIAYVDVVHSEDWMQNAYWMLMLRTGDCFGYYSTSRLLLTRLGYDVMEVQNCNGFTHYWCLVSIDEGNTWWHFDASCWSWGEDGVLCLVTDEFLEEYGKRHLTSDGLANHQWAKSLYPATPTEDLMSAEEKLWIYDDGVLVNELITYEDEYYYDDYDPWGGPFYGPEGDSYDGPNENW